MTFLETDKQRADSFDLDIIICRINSPIECSEKDFFTHYVLTKGGSFGFPSKLYNEFYRED